MNVRFEHISKKYKGKYALKDFSATLNNGVYGLLGTNGAGKTTLINAFYATSTKRAEASSSSLTIWRLPNRQIQFTS